MFGRSWVPNAAGRLSAPEAPQASKKRAERGPTCGPLRKIHADMVKPTVLTVAAV